MGPQQEGDGVCAPGRLVRVALGLVLVLAALPAMTASASDQAMTSDQVAAEILRVQAQADQTAQQWADANRRSDDLAQQINDAQLQLSATSARYDELTTVMSSLVIDRFTGGSGAPMMLLTTDVAEQEQKDAYRSVILDTGSADLDTVDAVRSDLERQKAHLEDLNKQSTSLAAELATRQSEIEAQLTRLSQLRVQLKNAEVKRAYEAQLEKQRQAEATAAAELRAKQAADQQAAATAAAAEPRGGGTTAPAEVASSLTPSANPTAEVRASAAPEPPQPPPVISNPAWVCPVAGPSAFGDTFGAPRPGGRRHEGVDMMSPFGTPLVAVVAGTVTMRTNTLGGNTISLNGADGNRYYYAHLSSWEGSSRGVNAGEVIGYVGHTGDTTANHLHFEIHPGGGDAVDPYPTVRQYC